MRDFTNPRLMDRTAANPFLDDIFVDQAAEIPGIARIHNQAFKRIAEAAESLVSSDPTLTMGRIFLVTAPRAGYGKSHLAARLRDHLRSIASSVVLPFDRSRPITWPVALSAALRQLSHEARTPDGSLNSLQEISRFALSRIVLEGLHTGRIRTKDLPCSEEALRTDYCGIFHPESPSRALSWADRRLNDLSGSDWPAVFRGPLLRSSELGFWSRIFVDLNLRGECALEPLRGLSQGEARERLLQLLAIATANRPIVFLADGLDGFYDSETAGMEISGILTSLRDNVNRSISVLLLNEEIWKAVFEGKLPTAWIDRIAGESSKLHSIPPEAATDLVLSRLSKIGITGPSAEEFAQQLGDNHLWIDAETKLSPRTVLRQARELWEVRGDELLSAASAPKEEIDSSLDPNEVPIEKLTDKPDFFIALQKEAEQNAAEADSIPLRVASPAPNPFFAPEPDLEEKQPLPEPASLPAMEIDERPDSPLVDIDSIINDIRGTGKSVVSETPIPKDISFPEQTAPSEPPAASALQVGSLTVREKASPSQPVPTAYPGFTPPPAKNGSAVPKDPAERLKKREEELLAEGSLQLDLERLEQFLCTIGKHHAGLSQQEERFPGTQTVCLQWRVRRLLVLIGFESPENVYFWNTLLQRTLSTDAAIKVSAFSHPSQPFDPGVFSEFGFSRAIVEQRIDLIEMGDRELAMIYSADELLSDLGTSPDSERAIQTITRYLDPLWRRISQPI